MTDDEARDLAEMRRELTQVEAQAKAIRARRNTLIVELYRRDTPVSWLADAASLGRQAIHTILRTHGARIAGRPGPPPGGWPPRPGS